MEDRPAKEQSLGFQLQLVEELWNTIPSQDNFSRKLLPFQFPYLFIKKFIIDWLPFIEFPQTNPLCKDHNEN